MAKKQVRPRGKPPAAEIPKNRVRESRVELGLTKVELAKLASLSEKTVDRVEKGQRGFRETTYRRLFNALNKARVRESLSLLAYTDVFPADQDEGTK